MAKYIGETWFTQDALADGINLAELFCRGTVAMVKLLGPVMRNKILSDPKQRGLIGYTNAGIFNSVEKFPRQVGKFTVEELANCMPTGPVTGFPTFFCTTFHNTAFLSFTYAEPLMKLETAHAIFDGIYQQIVSLCKEEG
jgi:hypothetical protein